MEMDDFRPQLTCEVMDERLGKLGYLVIDRLLGNRAVGGIRLAPDVTVAEVAGLARSMTLKLSFLNLSNGGAKAGITVSQSLLHEKREEILAAFGTGLRPLFETGIYRPGRDLGTSAQDIAVIRRAGGLPAVGSKPTDGAYYTAMTVVEAIRQGARFRGTPLPGSSAAIEGFGSVGSNVARFLAREGVRIVAVSTSEGAIHNPKGLDIERLSRLRESHGDHLVNEYTESERINLSALLLLEVDILVPCARAWTISEENAAQVRADMVVPGANIPVTRPAERVLFDMDTLYVPDFVANCGAVLAGSLASRGFRQEDIRSVIGREFALKVAHILEMAQARNTTPSETGREIAWQNFGRTSSGLTRSKAGIRGSVEKALRKDGGTLVERGASFLHRRGMLPFGYAHRLALAHARKLICAEQLRG